MTILSALARLPQSVSLRFAGYETTGHRNYIWEFLAVADELQIRHRVTYLGTLQRDDLLRECRQASIGVALFPKLAASLNERTMVGASNKIFEYLASGLVLLVSDLPDFKKTFVAEGLGVACDPENPADMAAAIRQLMENPEKVQRMRERAREKICHEWNYEVQFRPVADFVTSLGSTK